MEKEIKINESLLLTIVIPVYNTDPSLLRRALMSIPNDDRVGVVVYNDGSDNEIDYSEVIKDMITNDPEMTWMNCNRFYYNELIDNIGLAAVRNKSIDDIGSQYIMFLDSDDEVYSENVLCILNKVLEREESFNVIYAGISLIVDNEVVSNETFDTADKERCMVPYFTTPNIYNTEFLRSMEIYYGEDDRRTFEDIIFSVKLYLYSEVLLDGDLSFYSDLPIYKYYLEGQSLTRVNLEEDSNWKDKYIKLNSDLLYWISEVKALYHLVITELGESIEDSDFKLKLFNRLRYEVNKALEYDMIANGDFYKYGWYVDQLKPYKMNDILR